MTLTLVADVMLFEDVQLYTDNILTL